MSSMVIRWEDPPPNRSNAGADTRRVSKLAPLADELRARPGEWALVHKGDSAGKATGMATHIRLGQVRAFSPAGEFDAVSRRVADEFCVWAVYIGEDE